MLRKHLLWVFQGPNSWKEMAKSIGAHFLTPVQISPEFAAGNNLLCTKFQQLITPSIKPSMMECTVNPLTSPNINTHLGTPYMLLRWPEDHKSPGMPTPHSWSCVTFTHARKSCTCDPTYIRSFRVKPWSNNHTMLWVQPYLFASSQVEQVSVGAQYSMCKHGNPE